jgi:hypothetical protein
MQGFFKLRINKERIQHLSIFVGIIFALIICKLFHFIELSWINIFSLPIFAYFISLLIIKIIVEFLIS